MSERYSKLYSLPESQHAEGTPVIIAAGSLLKDSQTGNALAQIKFKSIADKTISALMVKIKAFDVTGKALKGVEEHQYLDLYVARNQEFGQKSPIMLPENVTRSFECEVTAVIFSDDTSWKNSGTKWESLPKQELLKDKLGELNEQYLRDTECKGELCPMENKDIWFCTCGGVNKKGEEKCSACSAEKEKIFSALSTDLLTEHKNEYDRLREEERLKKEAEEKEQQIKAEARAKRNKKIAVITSCVIVVCILFVSLLYTVIIPNAKYNKAVALMDAGKTVEAYEALIALNGYKDSIEKADSIYVDYIVKNQKATTVGDFIYFGAYEQDNDINNGKEDIEWIILQKYDNKMLLLSKNILFYRPFHDVNVPIIWQDSSIRAYLNSYFLEEAFSEAEQGKLLDTTNSGGGNPKYNYYGLPKGSHDKVFLLNIYEAATYQSILSQCPAKPTTRAKELGFNSDDWYLRTLGKLDGSFFGSFFGSLSYIENTIYAICYCDTNGNINYDGTFSFYSTSSQSPGVRPAIWVSIK